ncbi:MAG: hypothetical protein KBF93_23695 [Leptospiraceae bacterium]|nr:hypothetical protein [Leptospiraceae bacterium]
MKSFEQSDNTGFLFINEDKSNTKSPTYKGTIVIDGLKYSIAAWYRTSKKSGKKFLSLKVNPVANSSTSDFPPVGEDGNPEDVF